METRGLARQHDEIAVFKVGQTVGEGRERQRVGAEIHFSLAIADGERGALARADQKILLAIE